MSSHTDSLKVDLTGQIAIVTGASQGLGAAMAIALGKSGAKVACVARGVDKLAATVKSIVDAGGTAEAFPCNVADGPSVDKTFETVQEKWGRIDIVVNNAGITKDTLLPTMSDQQWDD